MEIYFKNDGSYDQRAVKIPVFMNGTPIGWITEVTPERVTCYLWDRFIKREPFGYNSNGAQNIGSISVELKRSKVI